MILPLPLPKSIKQSWRRMTRQSYENITRPTQYYNFFALGIDKKVVFVNHRPREPEIPFGRSAPPSSSAQCFPLVPFLLVTAVWPNGMVRTAGIKRDLVLARAHNKKFPVGWAETGDRI